MLDVDDFRALFPELSDAATVPDAVIQFYLGLAYASLDPVSWGARLNAGAGLYAAHNIALWAQRSAAAVIAGPNAAATAGTVSGIVTSKSVGGVSKSMDVSMGSVDGGGVYNTTTYGRQYLALLSTVGVGAMQF